jgi:hypothetical protein
MEVLEWILFIISVVSAVLFVIGLIRPGFVVWWSRHKSRVSVFIVWGGLHVLTLMGYLFLRSNQADPFKDNTAQQKTESTR